ncbi:type II toxin-antitoxin system HicA family toxin [Haloparvum sp. AD34]
MGYADFDGREIVTALRAMRYRPVSREGSHVKLRYENPETDEVRVVSVPLTDSDHISQDTYRSIAEQCGANDFDAWCQWIDENR